MNALGAVISAFEGAPLPDAVRRGAVRLLVEDAGRRLLGAPADIDATFVRGMSGRRIAEGTAAANAQHYDLPPAFFERVLGPRLKYSCCLFGTGDRLEDAEVAALAETCEHAGLADGQRILELGCGWGSLSLWMAGVYPSARITAVSNSPWQRRFIAARIAEQGLTNLEIITADMNDFSPAARFDRIVSVEMFEHMANWRALLGRIRSWLTAEGRLFIHVFSHLRTPYRFDADDPADWIARRFFTGGLMPSHRLIQRFEDLFALEHEWRWSGEHYRLTAHAWLANFDANAHEIFPIFNAIYGPEARLWMRRWRLFFLAVSGLFGHDGGASWGVSHWRLAPEPSR